MIEPRQWNRFKRVARDTHQQTASALLRDVVHAAVADNCVGITHLFAACTADKRAAILAELGALHSTLQAEES